MKNYTKVISLIITLTLLTGCSLPTSFDKKEVKEDESVVNEVVKESEETVEETTVVEETLSEEEQFEKMLADHYEVGDHDVVIKTYDTTENKMLSTKYTSTYAMPIDDEYDTWYINGVPVGKTINFRYDSNKEEYSDSNKLTNGSYNFYVDMEAFKTITSEDFKNHSKEMLTCYTDNLKLTDVADDPNAISLAKFYPSMNGIRFNYNGAFRPDNVIVPTNAVEQTVLHSLLAYSMDPWKCNKEEFSGLDSLTRYADTAVPNEFGGMTYTWNFAYPLDALYEFGDCLETIYSSDCDINKDFRELDIELPQSAMDGFSGAINMPDYEYYHSPGYISTRMTMEIAYNENNEVAMYTYKFHMPKAIWYTNADDGGYDIVQDGYNFCHGMIETGYFNIGLVDFEVTIHNKDLCPDLNINFIPSDFAIGGLHGATILE